VPPSEIEDVYFGCANQAGEDNRDVACMSLLLAGFPEGVAGATVNRL
jgi:acetyl-CoA acyltransferase